MAPSKATDVVTMTLEDLQRKMNQISSNIFTYMLLLLLDVHDDNVNGSGECNELILEGEQTVDWQPTKPLS